MEPNVKCIKIFDDTAYSGANVFVDLKWLAKFNKCPTQDSAGFKPTSWELIKNLGKLLSELQYASDDQTLAFSWAHAEQLYFHRGFALLREFKFLKDDLGKVLPSTRSMINFEQFLPFHNKKHTDKNCVPVEELPLFYKTKGKDYSPSY